MSKQGYLILHKSNDQRNAEVFEDGNSITSIVCYVVLQDGRLDYFANRDGRLLGSFMLSGKKLQVKAQKRADGMPNSFYVETRHVNIKDRAYTLGPRQLLELSANTSEERQEWGSTIHSWQRYYWKEPEEADVNDLKVLVKEQHTCIQLRDLLIQYRRRPSASDAMIQGGKLIRRMSSSAMENLRATFSHSSFESTDSDDYHNAQQRTSDSAVGDSEKKKNATTAANMTPTSGSNNKRSKISHHDSPSASRALMYQDNKGSNNDSSTTVVSMTTTA